MTTLAIVIPSYERGGILLSTIEQRLTQNRPADELIVVDQTLYEEGDQTARALQEYNEKGRMIWLQLAKPSIPHAMNVGLIRASSDTVLFFG